MSERSVGPHLDPSLLQGEISGRYRDILEGAASLFAERGYAATSIRDVGERVGLLGGSLYHHIKSKEALFVKIHDLALGAAAAKIRAAIKAETDPWGRLLAASVAMLEVQLADDSLTMPLMNDFRSIPPEVRVQLIPKRDEFEKIFVDLIADLPLAAGIDRKIYRLSLLTLLNNVSAWYRPGSMTPSDIGQQIMAIFHCASTP